MLILTEDSKMKSYEERCEEYDEYLRNHINGVKQTYNEVLRPIILNDYGAEIEAICNQEINKHDQSKYNADEYDAYLDNFYPADEKHKSTQQEQDAYDLAWLLHQKRNPHHWQYWVLIRDEEKTSAVDMPIEYIVEMLCDWHSFTLRNSDSTAYNWYNEHKDTFIFSKGTETLVKKYVKYLKKPLVNHNKKGDENND